jgi:hypothetical protein
MIEIYKEPNADSRTAKENLTPEELDRATKSHIRAVGNGLEWAADRLIDIGQKHDFLKVQKAKEFYDALISGKIKESDWYGEHIEGERHHLNAKQGAKTGIPKDVNLFDVLEHMFDCIIAGLSRSGEIYDVELPADLLKTAHQNTIRLVKDNVKLLTESPDDDIMNMKIES